ncbi:MAG: hypothetical protein Greene041679_489 [Parcubacteria group bacterium Greene0416_79]|nr:MAG: hypothetical protein Greene041679_489 [Parcubacteria group bacterium Greene0416_79]
MFREPLLRILAALAVLIALLHITAIVFYLYWTLWWYDMPLHFLGGAFGSLSVIWTVFFSGYVGNAAPPSVLRLFAIGLVGTLLLGVGWEVFERALGHTWSIEGYWLDTMTDLFLDMAGGFVGLLLFARYYATPGAT